MNYKLVNGFNGVRRDDGALIQDAGDGYSPAWADYQAWLAEGNKVAPADKPAPNDAIVAQIDAIESAHPFTHRYFREQLLAAVTAGIIPANHPVAGIAAAEDAQVQALRKQLK